MARYSWSWELFDAFIAEAAIILEMVALYRHSLGTEHSDSMWFLSPQAALTIGGKTFTAALSEGWPAQCPTFRTENIFD